MSALTGRRQGVAITRAERVRGRGEQKRSRNCRATTPCAASHSETWRLWGRPPSKIVDLAEKRAKLEQDQRVVTLPSIVGLCRCREVRPAPRDGTSSGATRDARRAERYPFLGYGDWTRRTSAALIGTGRTAKRAVQEIKDRLPCGSGCHDGHGPGKGIPLGRLPPVRVG